MVALCYARMSHSGATYSIRRLAFGYTPESPVIRGLDLEVGPGEFVAVIGPNGAGKSTLLKLMAGLLDGFRGEIELDGRSIGAYPNTELARKVAFVPQETHVVFPFTAAEIVRMGRLPFRTGFFFDASADADYVARAMERTETVDLRAKVFSDMSGGERQRVVLASALAQAPEVLLLDEPTVYLDIRHQLEFFRILTELHEREGTTVVAVTHDINLAARYAERMVVLAEGSVAADGRAADVLEPGVLHDVFGIRATIVEGPHGGRIVVPGD